MATGETPQAPVRSPDLARREESMGELFKDLSDDLTALVRAELRLAQAEMTEKGKRAGLGIGLLGGAGILGFVAVEALTATLIAVLGTAMKVWIGALIITAVYAIVAAVIALMGKHRVSEATPPMPEQTTETIKEDVQWAKTQVPSGRK